MSIYLDYNATTPINDAVLSKMIDVYRHHYGNADSRTHDYGDDCRKIVEEARAQLADLLAIDKTEIFFTSGSTESSNIALQGLREYANKTGKKHIVTTSIEHKAVLETVKALEKEGFDVDYVSPEPSGRVSAEAVLACLREDTLVVSVMHVNNETGIIQPVAEIGNALYEKDVLFHVDATQSCGKLVDELRDLQYDMMSISAHKMEGPQGVGALILRRKKYRLPPVKPIMYGGPQEHGISPGTTPVALVAGFGKACEMATQTYKTEMQRCKSLKEVLLKQLNTSDLEIHINGDQHERSCFFNIAVLVEVLIRHREEGSYTYIDRIHGAQKRRNDQCCNSRVEKIRQEHGNCGIRDCLFRSRRGGVHTGSHKLPL